MAAPKDAKLSKKQRYALQQGERRQKQEMAVLAQRYLDRHQPDRYRIRVMPDAIERRGETWFIVAEPDKAAAPTYDFINRITEASIELEDQEKLSVFLVPVMPPEDD